MTSSNRLVDLFSVCLSVSSCLLFEVRVGCNVNLWCVLRFCYSFMLCKLCVLRGVLLCGCSKGRPLVYTRTRNLSHVHTQVILLSFRCSSSESGVG